MNQGKDHLDPQEPVLGSIPESVPFFLDPPVEGEHEHERAGGEDAQLVEPVQVGAAIEIVVVDRIVGAENEDRDARLVQPEEDPLQLERDGVE